LALGNPFYRQRTVDPPSEPRRLPDWLCHNIIQRHEFAKRNPNSLFLSQQIEQLNLFEWLHAKRNIANYTNASPFEPDLCEDFLQVHKIGVRKALQTYLTDTYALYTFDKDHAVLALPLRFFDETQKTVRQRVATAFGEDFHKALLCLLKDKNGRLTSITQLIL
jgi:hypothetical protein